MLATRRCLRGFSFHRCHHHGRRRLRGADNVDSLVEVARTAENRMRIFLNIGRLGNNPGGRGEFLDGIEPADTGKALAAIERQRNWIVGIKARLSRGIAADHDLEVLAGRSKWRVRCGFPS